jgi:hypothetical protein
VDCAQLDDRSERLAEVHANALCEATDHPSRLVLVEAAVWPELVLKHPLAGHEVDTWRPRHKSLGLVHYEGVVLKLHCSVSVGICQCRTNGLGHRGEWCTSSRGAHSVFRVGLEHTNLGVSDHVVRHPIRLCDRSC